MKYGAGRGKTRRRQNWSAARRQELLFGAGIMRESCSNRKIWPKAAVQSAKIKQKIADKSLLGAASPLLIKRVLRGRGTQEKIVLAPNEISLQTHIIVQMHAS